MGRSCCSCVWPIAANAFVLAAHGSFLHPVPVWHCPRDTVAWSSPTGIKTRRRHRLAKQFESFSRHSSHIAAATQHHLHHQITTPGHLRLLLARKIQSCGANVTRCLDLLDRAELLQTAPAAAYKRKKDGEWEEANTSTMLSYEPVFLEALIVVSRAQQTVHRQKEKVVDTMDLDGINNNHSNNNTIPHLVKTALDLFHHCPTETCRARTIGICSLAGQYSTALSLLPRSNSRHISTALPSYHASLAACATHGDWSRALDLLRRDMVSFRTTLSCNIVLTALARAKQGSAALHLIRTMIMKIDAPRQVRMEDTTTTINNNNTLEEWPPPDRTSFHLTMNALCADASNATDAGPCVQERRGERRYSNLDRAYNLMNSMVHYDETWNTRDGPNGTMNSSFLSVKPSHVTLDLLASAYGRVGDWDMVRLIDQTLRHDERYTHLLLTGTASRNARGHRRNAFPDPILYRAMTQRFRATTNAKKSPLLWRWEQEHLLLTKRNNEKRLWTIGTYEDADANLNLTVALQPHRNPSKNGMKLLLMDSHVDDTNTTGTAKVGYLLMVNKGDGHDVNNNCSTLLGAFIQPHLRKQGLSKLILAIWLSLCFKAQLTPRTGVIHKPLLALVLQQSFGFVPETPTGGGVDVEISSCIDNVSESSTVYLYAPAVKSLLGSYSHWDLKREDIRILQQPASPRGRPCRVGASLILLPNLTNNVVFNDTLAMQLSGKNKTGQLTYNSESIEWSDVLLGGQ